MTARLADDVPSAPPAGSPIRVCTQSDSKVCCAQQADQRCPWRPSPHPGLRGTMDGAGPTVRARAATARAHLRCPDWAPSAACTCRSTRLDSREGSSTALQASAACTRQPAQLLASWLPRNFLTPRQLAVCANGAHLSAHKPAHLQCVRAHQRRSSGQETKATCQRVYLGRAFPHARPLGARSLVTTWVESPALVQRQDALAAPVQDR